jgi:hypothetical protein
MKFRNLKRKLSTLGVISVLSVLGLGFQNCARPTFSVDEAAKAKVLGETPVFGDERDPGVDPGGGDGRDPGIDPNDPVTGMPRDPGGDPTAPTTPRDPGVDTTAPKTMADFEFVCPLGVKEHGAYKSFVDAGELKAIVVTKSTKLNAPDKVCEIPDVRAQLISKRQIDITPCFDKSAFFTYIYIVEKSVTSDFKKYSLTLEDSPISAFSPTRIGYADMDDKANAAGCDVKGDPLLVQLANDGKPQPISLTSAEGGVMFDLLGKTNNYQKVQTAWFAETRSENYFLVLPDANGDVKGIDQLLGDNTFGPDGRFSKQGFAALAKHDDNRDKAISDEDVVFSKLRLWKDENLDGLAQASELFTLDQKGVVAIDIKIDREERKYFRTDSHGNQTKYRSIVVMKDGQYGLVYDLWLRYILK